MAKVVLLSFAVAISVFAPLVPPASALALEWGPGIRALENKVSVVTGGTRGIGRGIALGLGEQGATVYVTGRTESELIKTAEEVTSRGGKGIAVVVDHTDTEQIRALFGKIEEEQGRLDILVNNCFSAVRGLFGEAPKKYWERDLDWWDTVNSAGLRSHYIASQIATPLMLKTAEENDGSSDSDPGLIVIVSSWGGVIPIFDAAYGVGKAAKDRMAGDLANDLKGKPLNVVSIYPGAVLTEVVAETIVNNEEASPEYKHSFAQGESTIFQGRAVAALARDPKGTSKNRNGNIVITADLGEELGFTEEDGSRPLSLRSIKYVVKDTPIGRFVPRFVKVPKWVLALVASRF